MAFEKRDKCLMTNPQCLLLNQRQQPMQIQMPGKHG